MNRRLPWHRPALFLLIACCTNLALADSAALDALSSKDAAGGLRDALSKGIDVAVTQLGATDGFLNDPKVTIPLPAALEKTQRGLVLFGMGAQGEQLKATMNHAAESAVG